MLPEYESVQVGYQFAGLSREYLARLPKHRQSGEAVLSFLVNCSVHLERLYEKWIAVLNQANRLTINRIIEM